MTSREHKYTERRFNENNAFIVLFLFFKGTYNFLFTPTNVQWIPRLLALGMDLRCSWGGGGGCCANTKYTDIQLQYKCYWDSQHSCTRAVVLGLKEGTALSKAYKPSLGNTKQHLKVLS